MFLLNIFKYNLISNNLIQIFLYLYSFHIHDKLMKKLGLGLSKLRKLINLFLSL